MKNLFKASLITILLLFCFSVLFAQTDSTSLHNIVSGIVTAAEAKWGWVAGVVAVIALISEALALIPNKFIPANGVVDAILKIIRAIAGVKK